MRDLVDLRGAVDECHDRTEEAQRAYQDAQAESDKAHQRAWNAGPVEQDRLRELHRAALRKESAALVVLVEALRKEVEAERALRLAREKLQGIWKACTCALCMDGGFNRCPALQQISQSEMQ